MSWLSFADPSVNHQAAQNAWEPGTGAWFTRGQDFRNWLDLDQSFLWLHGTGVYILARLAFHLHILAQRVEIGHSGDLRSMSQPEAKDSGIPLSDCQTDQFLFLVSNFNSAARICSMFDTVGESMYQAADNSCIDSWRRENNPYVCHSLIPLSLPLRNL